MRQQSLLLTATGHYPTLTKFNKPWDFAIVDDVFSNKVINYFIEKTRTPINAKHAIERVVMNQLAKENKQDYTPPPPMVDGNYWNFVDYGKTNRGRKFELFLTIKDPIVQQAIKELDSKVDFSSFLPNYDKEKLFYKIGIAKCESGYKYPIHTDDKAKLLSIVVYLDPIHSSGTVLTDRTGNVHHVAMWRPNRAFIFQRSQNTLHYYNNTLQLDRHTLNIYITDHETTFTVTPTGGFPKDRIKQDLGDIFLSKEDASGLNTPYAKGSSAVSNVGAPPKVK